MHSSSSCLSTSQTVPTTLRLSNELHRACITAALSSNTNRSAGHAMVVDLVEAMLSEDPAVTRSTMQQLYPRELMMASDKTCTERERFGGASQCLSVPCEFSCSYCRTSSCYHVDERWVQQQRSTGEEGAILNYCPVCGCPAPNIRM